MIVDTSSLVAVLRDEPDADRHRIALAEAPAVRLSAATYVEVGVVVDAVGDPVLSRRLDDLLREVDAEVEPLTAEQARVARQAYRDFGRGSGHPARLNLGDVFSYALARTSGEALLFKGDDFSHTDLDPALRRHDREA